MRRVDAVPGRVHVYARGVDGGRGAGRGHVVSGYGAVRVLRVLHDRLPDRAVGDDRRGVPPADPGHGRRRGHVHRPLLHVHRAADVSGAAGMGLQARHVRRVRHRVHTEHVVLLLLLPGDQGQDVAGDRRVVREEETEKADRRPRPRPRGHHPRSRPRS